jgi:hypothetical protein
MRPPVRALGQGRVDDQHGRVRPAGQRTSGHHAAALLDAADQADAGEPAPHRAPACPGDSARSWPTPPSAAHGCQAAARCGVVVAAGRAVAGGHARGDVAGRDAHVHQLGGGEVGAPTPPSRTGRCRCPASSRPGRRACGPRPERVEARSWRSCCRARQRTRSTRPSATASSARAPSGGRGRETSLKIGAMTSAVERVVAQGARAGRGRHRLAGCRGRRPGRSSGVTPGRAGRHRLGSRGVRVEAGRPARRDREPQGRACRRRRVRGGRAVRREVRLVLWVANGRQGRGGRVGSRAGRARHSGQGARDRGDRGRQMGAASSSMTPARASTLLQRATRAVSLSPSGFATGKDHVLRSNREICHVRDIRLAERPG